MSHVIFSHGQESGPDSLKIGELTPVARSLGFVTEAIDYRGLDDPVARVERLNSRLEELERPAVLVGSSLGGYVSVAAAERIAVSGLFLMAPALFMETRAPGGQAVSSYSPRTSHTVVVHGWNDDIVPWQNSLKFAYRSRASFHLLDDDHRLEISLKQIHRLFEYFLIAAR